MLPKPAETAPDAVSSPFMLDGKPLGSSGDAAKFLGVGRAGLLHALYRAPDDTRYSAFEIPKRSGGVRVISAPKGLVRDLQEKLLPILQAAYDAHPASHGFVKQRSVVTNATPHAGQNLVLNVDIEDFFPSINFGRVRGLFMAQPFSMGPDAATIFAQLCTHKNGLPQGAPTSPVLSNFIATALDRRLTRLARRNRMRYSRYADDITFSTKQSAFPASIVVYEQKDGQTFAVRAGETLEEAITACGFSINARKVRLETRHVRQCVTGLPVNTRVNVERERIRKIRAMLHAWEKFGLEAAGREHFAKYRALPALARSKYVGTRFRNAVYGHLAFVKMVRGPADPVFLKLCAKLIGLDPNPSKFIRQMIFGAADYDIFISHASEDRAAVARPIYEACTRIGLKAFLDEEHIAWGEQFTKKINTALGAARVVLAVVSNSSVGKEWPLAEVNAALAMDIEGDKTVVVLLVGDPDLSRLPLLRGKNYQKWTGNAEEIVEALRAAVERAKPKPRPRRAPAPPKTIPRHSSAAHVPPPSTATVAKASRRSWFFGLFGRRA